MATRSSALLLLAAAAIVSVVALFSVSGNASPTLSSPVSMRTRAAVRPINPAVTRQLDVRRSFPSALRSKCVPVNDHATLCGKMVVIRSPTAVRAEGDSSLDADKLIEDVTSKLNSIENKGQVAIYAGASIAAVLVANGLVTTIDAIPVLPYLMKLVGTGYSSWFIYRYLLFDDSRKELLEDLEAIRKKVTGEGESA